MNNLHGASIVSLLCDGRYNKSYYINDVKHTKKQYDKIMRCVRKASHKLMKPIRVKLSNIVMKHTSMYSATFCKDVVNKICEYVY